MEGSHSAPGVGAVRLGPARGAGGGAGAGVGVFLGDSGFENDAESSRDELNFRGSFASGGHDCRRWNGQYRQGRFRRLMDLRQKFGRSEH